LEAGGAEDWGEEGFLEWVVKEASEGKGSVKHVVEKDWEVQGLGEEVMKDGREEVMVVSEEKDAGGKVTQEGTGEEGKDSREALVMEEVKEVALGLRQEGTGARVGVVEGKAAAGWGMMDRMGAEGMVGRDQGALGGEKAARVMGGRESRERGEKEEGVGKGAVE